MKEPYSEEQIIAFQKEADRGVAIHNRLADNELLHPYVGELESAERSGFC